MARWTTPNGLGLAHAALLFGIAAGCSTTAADGPSPHDDGANANAAGSAAEPSNAGSGGRPDDEAAPSAGAGGDYASVASAGDGPGSPAPEGAGGATDGPATNAAGGAGGAPPDLPEEPAYASSVESFEPGTGAGYNQSKLPDIVLGPPHGKGNLVGSVDVLSLGAGGEIVLGFGDLGIVDEPGPDLIVFENAFWPGGDATMVFAELGEVAVSEDGETWHAFPCDTVGDGEGNFPGCAGVTPTLVYDPSALIPLDPRQSGGDAFDLADLGLTSARFVKIRDLETMAPAGNTSGFDLDAVAAIHAR